MTTVLSDILTGKKLRISPSDYNKGIVLLEPLSVKGYLTDSIVLNGEVLIKAIKKEMKRK